MGLHALHLFQAIPGRLPRTICFTGYVRVTQFTPSGRSIHLSSVGVCGILVSCPHEADTKPALARAVHEAQIHQFGTVGRAHTATRGRCRRHQLSIRFEIFNRVRANIHAEPKTNRQLFPIGKVRALWGIGFRRPENCQKRRSLSWGNLSWTYCLPTDASASV
jgi:hypothetical protein